MSGRKNQFISHSFPNQSRYLAGKFNLCVSHHFYWIYPLGISWKWSLVPIVFLIAAFLSWPYNKPQIQRLYQLALSDQFCYAALFFVSKPFRKYVQNNYATVFGLSWNSKTSLIKSVFCFLYLQYKGCGDGWILMKS